MDSQTPVHNITFPQQQSFAGDKNVIQSNCIKLQDVTVYFETKCLEDPFG